ncbi:hypothetical protein N5853_06225 [Bartonella sp. HY329]|uniref:hypothetical protein n=1 Tax=unclassified Bartonella TaxID=2645622 RepID=UPI0021C8B743|nr:MULTISPECIES: hypothetical protein [unclassified Bartonella]UXM96203.1 hypothetical protein N5853_06225 [Bartonella sp. HY329]UXN10527.1 hypothetical protein N5852_06235 [Bartonella sp. HY328]
MLYYTLRNIGLILFCLILNISPTLSKDAVDFDYIKVRKQIEAICTNQYLSIEERTAQIYLLLPVTDEGTTSFYMGPEYTNEWDYIYQPEGKQCSDFINKAPSIVPVEMIIKKYQDVMNANPININKITNLKHNISELGSFYGVYWYELPNYMDPNIALPVFPGADLPDDYNHERTDAFLKLLRQQSDDYVLHFMLLVTLAPVGDFVFITEDFDEKMQNGTLINYASPELVKTFPQWYKAWNIMVPTMCQRFQSFYMDAQNRNPIQKACGDLITAKKYHVTREKQAQINYDMEHHDQ